MNDQITGLAFGLVILQIPMYGMLLFFSKSKWKLVNFAILGVHVILGIVAMSISSGFR